MMLSESTATVQTYPSIFETEVTFPLGPAGLLLEPVVRCGNRAIGARIVGFPPHNEPPVDYFVKGRTSNPFPLSPSTDIGGLAAEHLTIGSVLMSIDGACTKNQSFDRIMTLLHEKSGQSRRLRFKDVEASWLNSANRGSPSLQVRCTV